MPSFQEKGLRQVVAYLLLLAVLVWFVYQIQHLLPLAIERMRAGDPGGTWRLVLALSPVALGLVALVRWEKLSATTQDRLLYPLLVLLAIPVFDNAINSLDPDEPTHLHMAWLLAQGETPYRDFFTVRHLLWHAMNIPLVVIMKDNVMVCVVAKLEMSILFAATLVMLWLLSRELSGSGLAAGVCLLSCEPFVWGNIEFRSDPPATLLSLVALYLLLRRKPLWAGLAVGFGYLMIQKTAFAGIAIGLGGLAARLALKELLVFAVAASLSANIIALQAALTGNFHNYVQCCYVSSLALASWFKASPIWQSNATFHLSLEGAASLGTFLLAGLGLIVGVAKGSPTHRFVMVTWLFAFYFLLLTRLGYKQYSLFLFCLIGLLVAVGYGWLAEDTQGLSGAVPPLILCLIACVGLLRYASVPPPGMNLEPMQRALDATAPYQPYYGEGLVGHLSNPIFRPNATIYGHGQLIFSQWLAAAKVDPPLYWPTDLKPLQKNPPAVFVSDVPQRLKDFQEAMLQVEIEYKAVSDTMLIRKDIELKN